MTETAVEHHLYPSQVAFADGQPQEGSPTTLFRQRPTRSFALDFFSDDIRFPDGTEHEIWSFETDSSGRRLPAGSAGRAGRSGGWPPGWPRTPGTR